MSQFAPCGGTWRAAQSVANSWSNVNGRSLALVLPPLLTKGDVINSPNLKGRRRRGNQKGNALSSPRQNFKPPKVVDLSILRSNSSLDHVLAPQRAASMAFSLELECPLATQLSPFHGLQTTLTFERRPAQEMASLRIDKDRVIVQETGLRERTEPTAHRKTKRIQPSHRLLNKAVNHDPGAKGILLLGPDPRTWLPPVSLQCGASGPRQHPRKVPASALANFPG